jgi:hypothetical protein
MVLDFESPLLASALLTSADLVEALASFELLTRAEDRTVVEDIPALFEPVEQVTWYDMDEYAD